MNYKLLLLASFALLFSSCAKELVEKPLSELEEKRETEDLVKYTDKSTGEPFTGLAYQRGLDEDTKRLRDFVESNDSIVSEIEVEHGYTTGVMAYQSKGTYFVSETNKKLKGEALEGERKNMQNLDQRVDEDNRIQISDKESSGGFTGVMVVDLTPDMLAYWQKQWDMQAAASLELEIKDGYLHGLKTVKNGDKVQFQANYKNGIMHGESKTYRESGVLAHEAKYKEGKIVGLEKYYMEGGKLLIEIPYENGVRHGISQEYDQEGKMIREETYQNGEIVYTKDY